MQSTDRLQSLLARSTSCKILCVDRTVIAVSLLFLNLLKRRYQENDDNSCRQCRIPWRSTSVVLLETDLVDGGVKQKTRVLVSPGDYIINTVKPGFNWNIIEKIPQSCHPVFINFKFYLYPPTKRQTVKISLCRRSVKPVLYKQLKRRAS